MKGIAIIPARGGSKRIPRKNLLEIAGRPILERPISAALQVPEISEVVVSTDDQEIADLARSLGANVPGLRPPHLSLDETPTAPVIAYEVEEVCRAKEAPEFVVVLYPTSLFISSADLRAMIDSLGSIETSAEMVMTVVKFPAPIERAWRLGNSGVGIAADPSSRNRQSQEFEDHFYDAGQAYVSTATAWKRIAEGVDVTTALYPLPTWKSWDINTPDDLVMAEMIMAFSKDL
jgi:pseudaminic acid cytidylyltransferase